MVSVYVKTLQQYALDVVCNTCNYSDVYDAFFLTNCTNTTNAHALQFVISKEFKKYHSEMSMGKNFKCINLLIDKIKRFLKRIQSICSFSMYTSSDEKVHILEFFENCYNNTTLLKEVNESLVIGISYRHEPLKIESLELREKLLKLEQHIRDNINFYDTKEFKNECERMKRAIERRTGLALQLYMHCTDMHAQYSAEEWTKDVSYFISRLHDTLDDLCFDENTTLTKKQKVDLLAFINHCSSSQITSDIDDLNITTLSNGEHCIYHVLLTLGEFKHRIQGYIECILNNKKVPKYHRFNRTISF